jgi:hypothetical protein
VLKACTPLGGRGSTRRWGPKRKLCHWGMLWEAHWDPEWIMPLWKVWVGYHWRRLPMKDEFGHVFSLCLAYFCCGMTQHEAPCKLPTSAMFWSLCYLQFTPSVIAAENGPVSYRLQRLEKGALKVRGSVQQKGRGRMFIRKEREDKAGEVDSSRCMSALTSLLNTHQWWLKFNN